MTEMFQRKKNSCKSLVTSKLVERSVHKAHFPSGQ